MSAVNGLRAVINTCAPEAEQEHSRPLTKAQAAGSNPARGTDRLTGVSPSQGAKRPGAGDRQVSPAKQVDLDTCPVISGSARRATSPLGGRRPVGARGVSRFLVDGWFPPAPPSLRYAPRLTAWHGCTRSSTGQFGASACVVSTPPPPLVPVDFGHSLRSLEGADFLSLFINCLWGGVGTLVSPTGDSGVPYPRHSVSPGGATYVQNLDIPPLRPVISIYWTLMSGFLS